MPDKILIINNLLKTADRPFITASSFQLQSTESKNNILTAKRILQKEFDLTCDTGFMNV